MFTRDELTQVDATLYEPAVRKLAMTLRRVVRVNTQTAAAAVAVAYSTIEGKGKARVRRAGSDSDDKSFVGETLTTHTQPAYDVDAHIKWTTEEVDRARLAAMMGRAPSVPIDQYRIRNAQRIVDETIDHVGFVGAPDGQVKGILNSTGIQTAEASGTFDSLTPAKILEQIIDATMQARDNGVYNPSVMVIPPKVYGQFAKPYSDQNAISLRAWMEGQGMAMPTIIESRAMMSEHNGLGSDCVLIFDANPALVELSMLRDLERSAPFQTDHDRWEIRVLSKTAGIILREPRSVMVLTGV